MDENEKMMKLSIIKEVMDMVRGMDSDTMSAHLMPPMADGKVDPLPMPPMKGDEEDEDDEDMAS